jgi:hypothetical protein
MRSLSDNSDSRSDAGAYTAAAPGVGFRTDEVEKGEDDGRYFSSNELVLVLINHRHRLSVGAPVWTFRTVLQNEFESVIRRWLLANVQPLRPRGFVFADPALHFWIAHTMIIMMIDQKSRSRINAIRCRFLTANYIATYT